MFKIIHKFIGFLAINICFNSYSQEINPVADQPIIKACGILKGVQKTFPSLTILKSKKAKVCYLGPCIQSCIMLYNPVCGTLNGKLRIYSSPCERQINCAEAIQMDKCKAN